MTTAPDSRSEAPGRHDFDFLRGSWSVLSRRLQNPLDPASRDWREFTMEVTNEPILGGMGIQILSTPRGVISDRRARAEKVGGEVLALIH